MNIFKVTVTAVCWLLLSDTGLAGKRLTFEQAIEKTFRGKYVEGVQVGRHGFDLKPVGLPGKGILKTKDGVLYAKGYFRHRIKGKDDKVYYTIEARKGRAPVGKITKIEYNGWWRRIPNIKVDIGKIGDKLFRPGKWESAAQQIVDRLAHRLAKEL